MSGWDKLIHASNISRNVDKQEVHQSNESSSLIGEGQLNEKKLFKKWEKES